ncbi:AAA family ATPase [Amycolatopsis sp. NPDC005961]|uniref:AAA family ATPase n=1 Tax=Amycolatopsis sp. NPDC005961 TaxID=3156720 RepID=UPI0033EAEDEB
MTTEETTELNDILRAALAWHAAGASLVPVRADGSKAPAVDWKAFQTERADEAQLREWFRDGANYGLGVITGAVSGGLEMLEAEGRAIGVAAELSNHEELGSIWNRLTAGYLEASPGGGVHFIYRIEGMEVPGNTKLAQRFAADEELTSDEVARLARTGVRARRVLIESRGTGGFVVVAPSGGTVHETGRPWINVSANRDGIHPAIITADERELLFGVLRAYDQIPAPEPIPQRPRPPASVGDDLKPGDDFSARASWAEILEPHGWVAVVHLQNRTLWRRPGKRRGVSAVTGGDLGDFMTCWTTSSELPDNTGLSKWRVYAILNHGGDFSAAASALKQQGYGADRPLSRDPLPGYKDFSEFVAPSTQSAEQPATGEASAAEQQLSPGEARERDIERRAEEELRRLEAKERAKRRMLAKQLEGRFDLESVMIDAADLDVIEELPYLVADLLPESATTFLVGESGAGKSFVATAIGLAVATGRMALNRQANRKGRVLYIAGEGQKGLRLRIQSWLSAMNETLEPGALRLVQASPQLVDTAAVEQLRRFVEMHEIDLVIVDTLARSNVGADENSAQDQGVAVAALDRIRSGYEPCTLLAVHHAGKGGQYRGSTALKAAADTMISVTREAPGEPIVVTVVKQKDGEEGVVGLYDLYDAPNAPSAILVSHQAPSHPRGY